VPQSFDLSVYKNWGNEHGMELIRTSAKTGDGVLELFTQIANDIEMYCAGSRQKAADNVLNDICQPDHNESEGGGGGCC
jgi:putative protein kinase ArgK-like GTPase of G3E family